MLNLRRAQSRALRLPSIRSALTIRDQDSSGGQKFAVISDGEFHSVTLQCALDPRIDPEVLAERWTRFWGDQIRVDETNRDLVSVTVIVDFEPTTTAYFEQWCEEYLQESTEIEVPIAPLGLVTLTFRMRNGREADEDAAVVLGVRLPAIMRSLQHARMPLTPLTTREMTAHLARLYKPRSDTPPSAPSWPDVVPEGTEEMRGHLMHPGGAKTCSWLIYSRQDGVADQVARHVAASPLFPMRRMAMSYRRTRDDDGALLRRQIMTLSAVVPAGSEPNTGLLLGENTDDELPVAARLSLRRAYDRQGEIAALTSGVGVVLPEQGEIGEHPVLRDELTTALAMEAS